jgi:lysophosphatidylcholine acyltransferase/lyso-PAF acetyltransferase
MDVHLRAQSHEENSLPSNNNSSTIFDGVPICFSSDDECNADLIVDPFKHRLRMTKLEWCRTYMLAILIIPIRVILLLMTLLVAGLVSSVALFNLSEKEKSEKPIAPYWRKLAQKASALLGRACVRFCGFSVTVKGEIASAEEAPILVAAPHSGFFDAFTLFWSENPYLVSREENKNLPVLGKCIELSQSINVKREDPNSRQNTVQEIVRRTNLHNHPDPAERWPHLLIFPEGSTSNRKALMSFKLGAFYPGKPVQPVLLRYPNRIDTVTWTW